MASVDPNQEPPGPALTVDELHERAASRNEQLARLTQREVELTEELLRLAEQVLMARGGALSPAERALIETPLTLADELIAVLAAREPRLRALADRLSSLPRVCVRGPVAVIEQHGLHRDCWAMLELRVRLRLVQPCAQLELVGKIPPALDGQVLTVRVGETVHARSFAAGDLSWQLPLDAAAGELTVDVHAARAWTPRSTGESDDGRVLAWFVHELVVS
jgi:hypothetical protein